MIIRVSLQVTAPTDLEHLERALHQYQHNKDNGRPPGEFEQIQRLKILVQMAREVSAKVASASTQGVDVVLEP